MPKKLWFGSLGVLAGLGAALALGMHFNLVPIGSSSVLKEAEAKIQTRGLDHVIALAADLPDGHRAILFAEVLALEDGIFEEPVERARIVNGAIAFAEKRGEPRVYWVAGTLYGSGSLGPVDKAKAEQYFKQGVRELKEPARRGDPGAALVYARLQAAGYGGLKADVPAATRLLEQVYRALPDADLEEQIFHARHGSELFPQPDLEWALKFFDAGSPALKAAISDDLEAICAERYRVAELERATHPNPFETQEEKYARAFLGVGTSLGKTAAYITALREAETCVKSRRQE